MHVKLFQQLVLVPHHFSLVTSNNMEQAILTQFYSWNKKLSYRRWTT